MIAMLLAKVLVCPVSLVLRGAINITRQTIVVVIHLRNMSTVNINSGLRTPDWQDPLGLDGCLPVTSTLVERRAPVIDVVLTTVRLERLAKVGDLTVLIY